MSCRLTGHALGDWHSTSTRQHRGGSDLDGHAVRVRRFWRLWITALVVRPAMAVDFVTGPPLEETTYNELVQCFFNVPAAKRQDSQAMQAIAEECERQTAGITLNEYQAMVLGCVSLPHPLATLCVAGADKLEPMFASGSTEAATAPRNLTTPELLAMERGCPETRDDLTRTVSVAPTPPCERR